MIKARFLRRTALDPLREMIPQNLEAYRTGDFAYLLADHALYFEVQFSIDTDRLADLEAPDEGELHDVENCQTCYQSMVGLTPYEARDERLWAYITHTYMLEYARKRWPIPPDSDAAVGHIRAHFFAREQRQIERDNAASRLWWMAHLCERVNQMQLSDALKVFLHRTDVRASIIERPSVSQNVNLFSTIIRHLHELCIQGGDACSSGRFSGSLCERSILLEACSCWTPCPSNRSRRSLTKFCAGSSD